MKARSKRIEMKNKKNFDLEYSILALTVFIIPLLVRVYPIKTSQMEFDLFDKEFFLDSFTSWRAKFLVVIAVFLIISFCFSFIIGQRKIIKSNIYIPLGIYSAGVILSHFNAISLEVVNRGLVDRSESTFVLLAYIILFIAAYYVINSYKRFEIMGKCLLFTSIIVSIIAILQIYGVNVLNTEILSKIIGGSYPWDKEHLFFSNDIAAYTTLANPNYVGSFVALTLPLSIIFGYETTNIRWKYFYKIVFVLNVLLLLVSMSSAGYFGVSIALIIMYYYYRNNKMINFKSALMLTALTLAISVVLILTAKIEIIDNQIISVLIFMIVSFIISELLIKYKVKGRKLYIFTIITGVFGVVGVFFALNYIQDVRVDKFYLNNVTVVGDSLIIDFEEKSENHILEIKNSKRSLSFKGDKRELEYDYKDYLITINDPIFADFTIESNQSEQFDYMYLQNLGFGFFITDDTFYLIDTGKMSNTLEYPEHIPVRRLEDLGSGRFYIWSRTIPLLKDTLLWGVGADNYIFKFPQEDFVGKFNMGIAYIIVDKPHNWFLQVGVNTGVFSMLAILSLFVIYIKKVKYILNNNFNNLVLGLGVLVLGYHLTSIFNDSMVVVAPLFWIFYGAAFGIVENPEVLK